MRGPHALTTAIRLSTGTIALVVILTCLNSCLVPPMANMQSARCMDENQHRIAPYGTSVEQTPGVSGEPEAQERIASDFGFLIGIGTPHDSELQIRFDRIQFADERDGYNFTSIGPKFGLVEDVFAIVLPFGLYWNGVALAFDTIQLHPGAILTLPISKHLEINTAGKFILPLQRGAPSWYVVNLGLSLSTDVDQWALLPEVGFGWAADEGTDVMLVTYGLAVAFYPRSGE